VDGRRLLKEVRAGRRAPVITLQQNRPKADIRIAWANVRFRG
jgi:hypothetical protein